MDPSRAFSRQLASMAGHPYPHLSHLQQQSMIADSLTGLDNPKMGPMMRALTEDDIAAEMGQNNMAGINSAPVQSAFSQGSYNSQYHSTPFSPTSRPSQTQQYYSIQGHVSASNVSDYPPPNHLHSPTYGTSSSMGHFQRQIPTPSPVMGMGSPNGQGSGYPRSASAGPTIPSPAVMSSHSPFGSNSSLNSIPTNLFGNSSPPLQMNHASRSIRSSSALRSPHSLPSSSPVPMGPCSSPGLMSTAGNFHQPMSSAHGTMSPPYPSSKSPGSTRVFQYPSYLPGGIPTSQQTLPISSPRVRPCTQPNTNTPYVELISSKCENTYIHKTVIKEERLPSKRSTDTRKNVKKSVLEAEHGFLPKLEEMVAFLGESSLAKHKEGTGDIKTVNSDSELRRDDYRVRDTSKQDFSARSSTGTPDSEYSSAGTVDVGTKETSDESNSQNSTLNNLYSHMQNTFSRNTSQKEEVERSHSRKSSKTLMYNNREANGSVGTSPQDGNEESAEKTDVVVSSLFKNGNSKENLESDFNEADLLFKRSENLRSCATGYQAFSSGTKDKTLPLCISKNSQQPENVKSVDLPSKNNFVENTVSCEDETVSERDNKHKESDSRKINLSVEADVPESIKVQENSDQDCVERTRYEKVDSLEQHLIEKYIRNEVEHQNTKEKDPVGNAIEDKGAENNENGDVNIALISEKKSGKDVDQIEEEREGKSKTRIDGELDDHETEETKISCVKIETPERVSRSATPSITSTENTPDRKRKKGNEDASASDQSTLPLKKRKGRPQGSKSKNRRGNDLTKSRKRQKKAAFDLDIDKKSELSKFKHVRGFRKGRNFEAFAKGPVLRITGSIQNVQASRIINLNSSVDRENKKQTKKSIPSSLMPKGKPSLSSTVMVHPRGKWRCAFCGKPAFYDILDALYGPYYPAGVNPPPPLAKPKDSPKSLEQQTVPTSKRKPLPQSTPNRSGINKSSLASIQNSKFSSGRGRGGMRGAKGSSSSQETSQTVPAEPPTMPSSASTSKTNTPTRVIRNRRRSEKEAEKMEAWVHEDCLVWSQGVFAVGGALYGFHAAIREAQQSKCTFCKEVGATMGCRIKACKKAYHFLCATKVECHLYDENYTMACPQHKNKKLKMREGPS